MSARPALTCILLGWMAALLALTAGCGASVTAIAPAPTPPVERAPVAAATSSGPAIDAGAIRARLQRVATLAEAAGQCAAAVGGEVQAVRVRVETSKEQECVPCNRLPIGAVERGLPLSEVQLPVAPGSWVWLSADALLCVFWYDGEEFIPTVVTRW